MRFSSRKYLQSATFSLVIFIPRTFKRQQPPQFIMLPCALMMYIGKRYSKLSLLRGWLSSSSQMNKVSLLWVLAKHDQRKKTKKALTVRQKQSSQSTNDLFTCVSCYVLFISIVSINSPSACLLCCERKAKARKEAKWRAENKAKAKEAEKTWNAILFIVVVRLLRVELRSFFFLSSPVGFFGSKPQRCFFSSSRSVCSVLWGVELREIKKYVKRAFEEQRPSP